MVDFLDRDGHQEDVATCVVNRLTYGVGAG
jgi:hypothetical protein